MLKNNGSYERDVQQRCAKATSAFNSTKCLWSTPITNEVKLRVYLSAIRPIMMYGSETSAAPSTVMERLDCTERKLLRRHLATFGLGRPADRLVQRVLKSSSWKKLPGRKRKFWTEVVKEDLRTLGVDRQFRRDVRFRRTWNSDEWIDSVQALAEDRGWAELCSRTAHLGEDAGNRVRTSARRLSQKRHSVKTWKFLGNTLTEIICVVKFAAKATFFESARSRCRSQATGFMFARSTAMHFRLEQHHHIQNQETLKMTKKSRASFLWTLGK
ncbi:hypothetical protein RB195_005518 [Necator americanus]|uniref:Uncharacterized protein n=1 Tax=Necator americanus TaxID=51031 RepID=A0ABR1BPU6_NECAM